MPPLLQLRDIAVTLGGAPLLDGAELSISAGDRIAVVGRNGSGKSTLFRIAAGQTAADRGSRFVQPSARLAYLPQEPDLSGFGTTLDYVLAGLGELDDPHAAKAMMGELGLDPAADPSRLSGGEARRAALVRVLSPEPEILLLDEPTNHLDLVAIEWLEARLAAGRSALALISHDKRLLADLTRATIWLDRGRTRRLDQGFGAFEAWRDTKLEEEELERPQARPADRQRRALDALRRHRAAEAQHAPCRRARGSAAPAARGFAIGRRRRDDRPGRQGVGRAGD